MRHDNDNVADDRSNLRFLSVCSGIEAASVAWPQWQPVAFSEIEKFPAAVLAHHYPAVPNLGDFTKIDTTELGRVDILCGGTPCQAFSVAGSRQSLADARGNLTLAFVELAHELAAGNGLRNAVWENVPGVLNTKDNAFGCFLAGIVGADDPLHSPDGSKWPDAGMVAGPRARAAWRVLDAQYFGLAQRRRRVILVADFGNGADPAAVLFEREGLSGNTPPSREAGESVAPTISARTKGGGGLGTDFDLDGGLIEDKKWPTDIAPTLNAAFGDKQGLEDQHALNGAGLFVPSVQVVHGTQDPCNGGETAFALGRNSGQENVVAFGAFKAEQGAAAGSIAFNEYVSPTLSAADSGSNRAPALLHKTSVRRLTPTECERLMGFPDNYTAIPWRGKPADQCPDGPRYKALGNSWAVPLFTWLGHRIDKHIPTTTTHEDYAIAA